MKNLTESYDATVKQILSGNSIRVECIISIPSLNFKALLNAKTKLWGVECMPDKGKASRDYLERELLDKVVTIKTAGGRDKQNRLLVLVLLGNRNINTELVERNLCYKL